MAHDNPENAKARVERWRANKRAVTLAAKGGEAQAKFQVANQCTKCTGGVVCPEHEKLREEVLKTFKLQVERATHHNRNNFTTGAYGPAKAEKVLADSVVEADHGRGITHKYTDEGKAIVSGRYTARVGTKDVLQLCAEVCVQHDQERGQGRPRDPEAAAFQMWRHSMLRSAAYVNLAKKLPNMSVAQRLKVLWLSPVGRGTWRAIKSGQTPRDSSPRRETLDELLKK